jgi:hypothetical protein
MSSLTPIKELNAKKDVNPATIPPEVIELPKDIISKEDAPIFENTLKKKPLSRSATNPRRISISGATVSRARSVFGLDSLKNRETKAISMWKNVVSQLITNERENDNLGDHNNDLLLQTPFVSIFLFIIIVYPYSYFLLIFCLFVVFFRIFSFRIRSDKDLCNNL